MTKEAAKENTNSNEGADKPLELEVNPNERFVSTIRQGSTELPTVDLKIKNPTTKNVLFKVKCTSNELFKIRPPLGLLKPGDETTVKLTLLQTQQLPPNDHHYFSIYSHNTTETAQNPREQWQGKAPEARKRQYVQFKKAEEDANK